MVLARDIAYLFHSIMCLQFTCIIIFALDVTFRPFKCKFIQVHVTLTRSVIVSQHNRPVAVLLHRMRLHLDSAVCRHIARPVAAIGRCVQKQFLANVPF